MKGLCIVAMCKGGGRTHSNSVPIPIAWDSLTYKIWETVLNHNKKLISFLLLFLLSFIQKIKRGGGEQKIGFTYWPQYLCPIQVSVDERYRLEARKDSW